MLHPINCLNYRANATFDPIMPRIDPVAIWNELFGSMTMPASAAWDRSILDALGQRYANLAQRLGAADRQRLEQHLEKLRELEQSVVRVAQCSAPEPVDTSDYNPKSGLNSADDGSIKDLETDGPIPTVSKLMMDMMVMASPVI